MRSLTITMYLLSICLLADAQQVYTYMLTDGWKATKAFDFGDDTCVIVGLVSDPNPSTNHRFHFTTINSENKVLKVDTFKLSSSDYVSYNSPFGLYSLDERIIIAGLMSNGTAGLYNGAAFTFSKKVEKKEVVSVAHGSTSSLHTQIYSANDQLLHFGGFQDGTLGNSVQTYLTIERLENTLTRTFNNGTILSNYGDCIMLPKQVISTSNESYLLISSLKPVPFIYRDIHQGLIIKVDSVGTEQWRLPIWEDSTTVYNLVVVPMSNGNYLAAYQDLYYQPDMPPRNTNKFYSAGNKWSVPWFVEFDKDGKILRKWNLRKELEKKRGYETRYWASFSHFLVEDDGSILLIGSSRANGKYGFDVGFLLKLDKYGKYKWYRQYELSISTPYNGGQENLFTAGITKLASGGYALAGEYRSQPSDSFPTGTQRGIVLFTDSFGCMEPGCQENDNISVHELQAAKPLFSVHPNPSSGVFQITNTKSQTPNRLEVYDAYGRLVYAPKIVTKVLNVSHLTSNIYYLKIYRSDGFHETHKIILQ